MHMLTMVCSRRLAVAAAYVLLVSEARSVRQLQLQLDRLRPAHGYAAPSVHVAATPSVFIQPSRGHNPIHTRLQPYPASSSARCPASPNGPPYSLDEHGSCRTSSESSTSPALRLLRRVFCWRRSARSERVHDALIGNQRCLRPARLGGRWGHHVGVGSRAGGDVVLPQGRRVGGFAAGLVAPPPPARAA